MSLKALCIQNMVEQIKNLPPLLMEEIIGESLKAIKEDAKKEAMKEIRSSASVVIEDITDRLITSRKTGKNWTRPEYTQDIDDELYYTFVDAAEMFVSKHEESIVFSDQPVHRRQTAVFYGNYSDGSDRSEEDDDY